jgi:hypothetical protein
MMSQKNKQLLLVIVLLTMIHALSAQSEWDSIIVERANTARENRNLKDNEKQVIFYTNLARADGKLFAATYLKRYMDSTNLKPTPFTRSLERELRSIQNLPMLHPETDLYDIAREHAIESGKTGRKGHQGFKKRFSDLQSTYFAYGENCYYGWDNPLAIVIKLLIDEGITDLGHRFNMLDPRYNSIGVSIMPHKTYGYNCVMEFGSRINHNQK